MTDDLHASRGAYDFNSATLADHIRSLQVTPGELRRSREHIRSLEATLAQRDETLAKVREYCAECRALGIGAVCEDILAILTAGGDAPTIVPAETPGVPLGDYFQSTTLDQGA